MFPFGGYSLIVMDYKGPDRDPEDVRKTVRQQLAYTMRTRGDALASIFSRRRSSGKQSDEEKVPQVESPAEKTDGTDARPTDEESTTTDTEEQRRQHAWDKHIKTVTNMVINLFQPITIAMIIGLVIALVRPLKGLFVHIPNTPIPNAPDGQPPLAFVMDTTGKVIYCIHLLC